MDHKRFAILPMVLIFFAACHSTKSDSEFDKYMDKTVADFNLIAQSESEQKERRLLLTTSGPGRRITFRYKLKNFTATDINTTQLNQYSGTLRNDLPNKINKTELFKYLSNNKVILIYEYSGSDGSALFRIKLVPIPGQGYVPV